MGDEGQRLHVTPVLLLLLKGSVVSLQGQPSLSSVFPSVRVFSNELEPKRIKSVTVSTFSPSSGMKAHRDCKTK